MPKIGTRLVLHALPALAMASALLCVSGCGGGSTPAEKNIKATNKLSPEVQDKMKAMQEAAKPLPKNEEDPMKGLMKKKKGATKGGAR